METLLCNIHGRSGLRQLLQKSEEKNKRKTRSYLHFQEATSIYRPHNIFERNRAMQLKLSQRCQCQEDSAKPYGLEKQDDNISQATLIWRAIKLPIYSVALVPLTVGSASAFLQTGKFSAKSYFTLLASSILIITWINLSNDVYDFDTGADKNKKESVVNLCPPFRWSYYGLGEPLCFAAFGPFATTAFYFLQGSTSCPENLPLNSTTLCVSILVGFTTSLILFCSHFHQVEEDSSVGKISPLVRLGTSRGSSLVKVAVGTLYTLLVVFGLTKDLPFPCILLCLLTVPMGFRVVSFVGENHGDKTLIFMAKYICVRLHTLFGAALAAGLVIARIIGKSYIPRLIVS